MKVEDHSEISSKEWLIGGSRRLLLDRTCIMGVLNITPDSFSDGGRFLDSTEALRHAETLIEEGAGIIDIGGESTRPGSREVSAEEELNRVIPIVYELARRTNIPISIDTSKAVVAQAALDAGATIVNDISGLTNDPEMASLVGRYKAGLVLMHIRGKPSNMQAFANYLDVVSEVRQEMGDRFLYAIESGIEEKRVVLDPGIGFAKTAAQNLVLLNNLGALKEFGRPILLGTSRKSFIGAITNASVEDRLPGTIATVVSGVLCGAAIVRVHDVKEIAQAVLVVDAIRLAEKENESAHQG